MSNFNPEYDKVSWSKRSIVGNQQITVRVIQYGQYEPKIQILKHKLNGMNEPTGYNTNRYRINQIDCLIDMLKEAKDKLKEEREKSHSWLDTIYDLFGGEE